MRDDENDPDDLTLDEVMDALRSEIDVVRSAQEADVACDSPTNADKLKENSERLSRVAQSIQERQTLVRPRLDRLKRGQR